MSRPPSTDAADRTPEGVNRAVEAIRPVFAALVAAGHPGIRRDGDREVPAGPKAQRTRRTLLEAAERLFVAHGYQATSVAQVAEAAGVSLGTFYQYFRDRGEIVAASLRSNLTAMLERADTTWHSGRGRSDLRRVLENFVSAYAGSAALAGVWEEVCHIDSDMAALRRDLGRIFTEAVERELVRGGRMGTVRRFIPDEAALAARALAGMVDRFCYVTYVFDPPPGGPPSPEQAAAVLTELWAGAVGLADEA